MGKIRSSQDIAERLDQAEVAIKMVRHLLGRQREVEKIMDVWPNNHGVYRQLQRLAEFIAQTRTEISALRPEEVKESFIPTASDELDAIVEATADATHRIMDAADVIMNAAAKLPSPECDQVNAAVTSIYEACTFQDITGQRVTKVINVLKVIEGRVEKLVEALGEEAGPDSGSPEVTEDASLRAPAFAGEEGGDQAGDASKQREKDAKLLNGPALPGSGSSQDDVDAILGIGQ